MKNNIPRLHNRKKYKHGKNRYQIKKMYTIKGGNFTV